MTRRRTAAWLAPALLAGAAATGCVATQRDILDLESQADSLKSQVGELKKAVATMQANQADLSLQMKQLHEDLSVFTEAVRENQGAMTRLSSKLDDMSAAVTSRVAQIGTSLSAQQAKGMEEAKAALAAAGTPTELFQEAEVRLGLKNYDLAAKGFEEYLKRFPKGALADAAVYKLGQSLYGQGRWEQAGRQFAAYLDRHPSGELTPSARLLYALCLVSLRKNLSEARQYLESIPADFPRSPEAKAAAEHLKKLAAASKPKPKAKGTTKAP